MNTFRDLIVWQKAHELVLQVYKVTGKFPDSEKFGLLSQMRRASFSVPANIVEGFKRRNNKEFKQFINIASGSLEELRYYFLLSSDLKYIDKTEYQSLFNLSDDVGKMLFSLHKKLNSVS
ncbi:MAG: four helix bundle protein [Elusimicrobia bacterium RIFOXYD2_FULL_34_15]|nr:MAG: four helix bundle protein [Elusimicrobia bacterium RIFOXYD2_FULL_34_15]